MPPFRGATTPRVGQVIRTEARALVTSLAPVRGPRKDGRFGRSSARLAIGFSPAGTGGASAMATDVVAEGTGRPAAGSVRA